MTDSPSLLLLMNFSSLRSCFAMKLYVIIFYLTAAVTALSVTARSVSLPPAQLDSVNTAIANAVDGDTIIMDAGIWTGCSYTIILNKRVTLSGPGAVIQCSNYGTVFSTATGCEGASIQGISIVNASSALNHTENCNVTMIGVSITHCTGRALIISHPQLMPANLAIIGCTLSYNLGGAIIATSSSRVDAFNITVTNNGAAASDCGAVCVKGIGTAVVFESSLISANNVTRGHGAGVFVDSGGRFEAYNTTISYNSERGGLYATNSGSVVVMTSCLLEGNGADNGNGGAVFVIEGAALKADQCVFSNNLGGYGGGGIRALMAGTSVQLSSCTFSGNKAENGAAIYLDSGASVQAYECEFMQNEARYGGAVRLSNQTTVFKVALSSMHENTASVSGGAIYAANGARLEMFRTNITNNTAVNSGGGVSAEYADTVIVLSECRITANSVPTMLGGGLSCTSGANVLCNDTDISYNDGGGVFMQGDQDATAMLMSLTTLQHNTNGGAVYMYGARMETYNCTINDNVAGSSSRHGGIHAAYSNIFAFGMSVLHNDDIGIYNDGTSYINLDTASRLCRNNHGQSIGTMCGSAEICGTISHVTSNENNVTELTPGMTVSVHGFDMKINSSDVIIQADIVTIHTAAEPFSFNMPERREKYTGPMVIHSALGRRSESYADYDMLPGTIPVSSNKITIIVVSTVTSLIVLSAVVVVVVVRRRKHRVASVLLNIEEEADTENLIGEDDQA